MDGLRLRAVIEHCPLCGGRHEEPGAFYLDEEAGLGLVIICPTPPPGVLQNWFDAETYLDKLSTGRRDIERLMGHAAYRRGRGGALRQVRG